SRHADLWHPRRGPKMIINHMVDRIFRPLYDLLAAHHEPGNTVLCAHPLDLASRVASESWHAPLVSVVLAPGIIWTVHDTPRANGALLGPAVPRWLKQMQFWAADRFIAMRMMGAAVNGLRKELGLPPVRHMMKFWLLDCDMLLGLFPNWFGPQQPDWPANTRNVGFPLWDAPGDRQLSDSVQEFLATGTPPIAFSPGSANHAAHQFFRSAVDACQRLGRRGILLTKYDHQLPPNLPPTVRHFGFVPLSKLLPRSAALVHHGGIGSCAQGLAAGIPQIVQPMSYDQFDNARRLIRLGVGKEIAVRRFTGPRIAAGLSQLLSSSLVAQRCRDLASRCNGPAALTAACEALEHSAAAK
ncbi:MAG TPA: nucleotide disphospho-sugar-binding domain-containing protein, partial [Lacipirellulaceae bacterium]|nr:nucleotide disphospho-sugar-binding domain-containing protein [Lacipirellulaceae bacterium]